GASVTDLDGEQPGQAVEQLVTGRVPEPAPLAAGDDRHRRVGAVATEAREVHPEVSVRQRTQLVGITRVDHGSRLRSAPMGQGISEVLPFAIGIAISPIPIIAIVLILFSNRATVNGLSFLVGWMLGLAVVGTAVYLFADAANAATDSTTSDTISWGHVVL